MKVLSEPIRFEWDRGNVDKNLIKHKVTNSEIEEVFYDNKARIRIRILQQISIFLSKMI